MGLSNTGTETIRVDAEILPELSPIETEGTYAGYEYTDTTTDLRYLSFNTKTSKLWNAFSEEFATEIKDNYKILRNSGIFTVNNILKNAQSITDDMIGEVYFNKDAASKYLSQTNEQTSEYLKMLHGNRLQKYKKFLTERIIFLDTIYDYMESDIQADSRNSIITLRSDALYGQSATETLKCYLGISVYSPQYVTISVGSGQDAIVTAYVGPESTYKDPDTGIEHEGTLFSFPIRGTDKEMTISGAGNIKDIAKIQALNVRDLIITKAERILNLDLSYSSRMTALTMGNNRFLRTLNCSNSYLLGTATNGQTLDLSKCANLKELNLAYTKLSAVTFPPDNVINKIDLTGSSIKNIEIDGAEFLTDIVITDCDNINKFQLNRCNKIENVNVANATIQNFIVTNCDNVKSVDVSGCKSIASFDVTNSYNIEVLNMKGNTSSIMQDLKLYSMYNLKELIVSQTTTAHTIRLPKYLNEVEAFKASNGEMALPWNTLEKLDINSSSVMKIQYGSADVEGEVVDMSQLTNLKSLNFNSATSMTEIKGINYTGNLGGLFSNCKALVKITGELSNSTNNINSMFSSCYLLSNIDGLNLNFVGVVSANSTCDRCFRMKTPMLKKILYACGSTLTTAISTCHMAGMDGYSGILGTSQDTTRTIPSDLFARNTNLQNINGFFDITAYTTVPGDLFDPCANSITNLGTAFGRMSSLTTVGGSLLHNKPKLTTVSNMFANCTSLTNFIDEYPDIFIGSPNITSTYGMFANCYNLLSGDLGLGEMLYPLVNLTNCAYMFYNCSNNLNCEIPDGFLSKNTKLTKINGLFQRCRKLPTLPRSLFRANIGDTNNLNNLTKAVAVFGECNSMEGIVDSTFFLGAPNLVNIGYSAEDNQPWSTNKYPSDGFFQGTKISGYHETFLNPVTKLQNVSGLFRNCYDLIDCHYYEGSEVMTRGNSISEDLFINNNLINNMENTFSGCSKLEGHIPMGLLDNSKSLLQTVGGMFSGCTALTGINLDVKDGDDPQTGICAQWFKNATNLVSINSFMSGCSAFVGTIPEDLFENCVKLQNTAYLFQNCRLLTGGVPLKLFDSCRDSITNTSYMFSGCEGLDEELPTGEYETVQGIVAYKLVSAGIEGALQVVETMLDPFTQVPYADVVNLSPNLATIINASGSYYVTPEVGDVIKVNQLGLLSECVQLTSIAYMFNGCKKMPGGIPHDLLFTSKQATRYTKLTNIAGLFKYCEKFTKVYTEEETGMTYICDPILFDKCTALTNCSEVFNRMGGIPSTCQVHPNMFSKQSKVTTVYELFSWTPVTGPVSSNLFANSVNTITDARKMFNNTNITSIAPTFLNGGGINKKLQMIYGIFQGCSNLGGTAPEFWNGAKFTALQGDQQGYWGALHGCTNLSNYSVAQAVSTNWTDFQPIYK